MKKATKRKIILSGILFHMILVFTACGLCNKATFIGDDGYALVERTQKGMLFFLDAKRKRTLNNL